MEVIMKKGQLASQGFAIAKAKRLLFNNHSIKESFIEDTFEAINRYDTAVSKSIEELENIKKQLYTIDQEFVSIFDAHIQMVKDPDIKRQTVALIEKHQWHPAYAYKKVTDEVIKTFKAMENLYFKARSSDVLDIQHRVLNHLLDIQALAEIKLNEDVIIIAHDLTPSETAKLDLKHVKGFITEVGGVTSHTAIMARALNIPSIVAYKHALNEINDDDIVVLDGLNDELLINPDEQVLSKKRQAHEDYVKQLKKLQAYVNKKTYTKDQFHIPLYANVGSEIDITHSNEVGAEGIGLYRTEFLFFNKKTPPTEEEQYKEYKKAFDANEPVMIRTLDVGGDKPLFFLENEEEMNPYLGFRGIRISLAEKTVFKTQIRAILRAAKNSREAHILLPMVSRLDELFEVKRTINEVVEELKRSSIEYQNTIRIGVMIEVPSVAFNAKRFAKHVDFFSIGTNDLTQYFYAADRMNQKVSHLNDYFDPLLLNLLQHVIHAAHDENIPVGVCGEMAQDLHASLLLVGMGVDELSMTPNRILTIREQLKKFSTEELRILSDDVLSLEDADSVRRHIDDYILR